MTLQIRILSGARAGPVLRFSQAVVTVGRHPSSDLRFDPDADLDVSARHAELRLESGRWWIRDLGSRNGTFVNGRRLDTDVELSDGDRVGFGATGPVIEVRTGGQPLPAATTSITGRIRMEVARRTRVLRLALAMAVMVLAATIGAFLHWRRGEVAAWDRERAGLEARIDSVLASGEATIHSLEGRLEALTAALRRSQAEIRRLAGELERAHARGDASEAAELRRRLQEATVALQRQQLAATVDYRAIERRNRRAVALIYVEAGDGTVSTATAFAVRPDATLVTSRHVLFGENDTDRPRRIAVQFSDSDQVWPARILATSSTDDLALVKVDNILGDVPTVQALSARGDTLSPGSPVASIGFPLGGAAALPGGGAQPISPRVARPLVTAGIVLAVAADRLEVQGYGAAGASGSPIFDAEGDVVGVLYAGYRGEAGHTILAAPVSGVVRLLESGR